MKFYGTLSLNGEFWHIENLPPHVSLRFKSIFKRVLQGVAGTFRLKNSPDICEDLHWFMQRYPLQSEDLAFLNSGVEFAQSARHEAMKIFQSDWQPSATNARFKAGAAPFLYQAQAATLACQVRSLLIMDDVGLGKTFSALTALIEANSFPAAVVVQPHLAEQWAEEFIADFTDLTCHVIKGTKPYELPQADIYIFKYSNIAGWAEVLHGAGFKASVFDEIQELRHGREAAKGSAAYTLASATDLKIGLSATPIYNYGDEIFNVVEAIRPGSLGTREEFHIEWCVRQGQHCLVKDPVALGSYLREVNLAIRRLESDVENQLPPVNSVMHHVDYDAAVIQSVEDEARSLAMKVMSGSFNERGIAALELDALSRRITGLAKAKSVSALVRMLAADGQKILLTGWHRDVYTVWQKELHDLLPVMYTGSESSTKKRKSKDQFVNGMSQVMIMSLRSGAGLNGLQMACNTVVFGELDWSPQVHKQVIGRLRRPGQTKQVDAIYAHTNGGSDPVIIDMLGIKASQSQGIVDPFLSTVTEVESDTTRIRALAKYYLDNTAQEKESAA